MIHIERVTHFSKRDLPVFQALAVHQSQGESAIALQEEQMMHALANANFHLFVAKEEKESPAIWGMASLVFQQNIVRTIAEIHDVVVHPDARGRGIGRTLMRAAIQAAQEHTTHINQPITMYLTSRPSRVVANALYLSLQFELVASAMGEHGTNLYKKILVPSV